MDSVLCTGINFFGQFGIGDKVREEPSYVPIAFGQNPVNSSKKDDNVETNLAASDVKDVQCGGNFTIVLTKQSNVW